MSDLFCIDEMPLAWLRLLVDYWLMMERIIFRAFVPVVLGLLFTPGLAWA